MAIAFGAVGAKVITGTTTLAIAYPASVGAGDLVIAGRAGGNEAVTFTAEWTNFVSLLGGLVGTNANDSHQTRVGAETTVAAGGETGTVTFDQTGTVNGMCGVMARYTKDAGMSWNVAADTGDDNTHAANRSITTSGTLAFAAGDMLVAVVAVDTDTSLTITGPALTASGITFGTTTQRAPVSAGYITGNDGNIYIFDAAVSSGSGTVAAALAFTTATSQCGPAAFVRLREVPVAQVPPILPVAEPLVVP